MFFSGEKTSTKHRDVSKIPSLKLKLIFKYSYSQNIIIANDNTIYLLILPYMDIDLPIKTLMKIHSFNRPANIHDDDFNKIKVCERFVPARFFKGNEFT